jgi:D-glycero-D-manno-heptose 1,7-bisphosphate phosphatase
VSECWERVGGGLAILRSSAAGHAPRFRRAVFLDRDGVLNAGTPDPVTALPESPLKALDVRLLPGVTAALTALDAAGYALVCVSNQPAAAKGKTTVRELLEVHERVLELLAAGGAAPEMSLLCLHHPEGVVAELAGRCDCRKPEPGMLLRAAVDLDIELESSWMVGDTDADVAAGRAAGCATVLLEYAPSAHKRSGAATADLLAKDLPDAAAQLLDRAAA